MHAAIFIDIHTLLCSNLFALSDTPNIVTPDTTLIGPGLVFFAGQLLSAPPRSTVTKKSHVTTRLWRQRSSFQSKEEKEKAVRRLVISRSFYCAGVAPCQQDEC